MKTIFTIFFLFTTSVFAETYNCFYEWEGGAPKSMILERDDNSFLFNKFENVQILFEDEKILILGSVVMVEYTKEIDHLGYRNTIIDKSHKDLPFRSLAIFEPENPYGSSAEIFGECKKFD